MQLDRTSPYSSLLLLKTLCEKRNLAAAAEVLGLSASSASRHLSEMRELFDDKLFTRFPGGLVPTRRALEIAAQSEPILDGYAALMRPARFNPAEMTREVRIGCADNAPFSLFPKFADCLLQQAPNITISFLPLAEDRFLQLSSGELDFVVSPVMAVPPGLRSIVIGRNEYVLAAGFGSPLAAESRTSPLSTERVLQESFADVCFRTQPGAPYTTLREIAFPDWREARSSLRTTNFLSAVTTLSSSRLIMVLPKKTADTLANAGLVAIVETQAKSVVQTPHLIWHHRTDQDLAMQWVRSVLLSSAQET